LIRKLFLGQSLTRCLIGVVGEEADRNRLFARARRFRIGSRRGAAARVVVLEFELRMPLAHGDNACEQ